MRLTGALNVVDKSMIVKEYATIHGNVTVEYLRDLEAQYPKASKIHVVTDGAGNHCNKVVKLLLNKSSEVNRSYLEKHYRIALPNDSVILSRKIKKKLEIFVEQEEALFTNKSVLNITQVTVGLFWGSFFSAS